MAFSAQQVSWTDEARCYLARARATAVDLQEWQHQAEQATAQLWQFTGDVSGYLLTRVEQDQAGNLELVLVAGAGENAQSVIAWATELAKKHGIPSMRTHINRPGLQRLYERQGWQLEEWVMRIKTNGQ